jgi:hypothetical protein
MKITRFVSLLLMASLVGDLLSPVQFRAPSIQPNPAFPLQALGVHSGFFQHKDNPLLHGQPPAIRLLHEYPQFDRRSLFKGVLGSLAMVFTPAPAIKIDEARIRDVTRQLPKELTPLVDGYLSDLRNIRVVDVNQANRELLSAERRLNERLLEKGYVLFTDHMLEGSGSDGYSLSIGLDELAAVDLDAVVMDAVEDISIRVFPTRWLSGNGPHLAAAIPYLNAVFLDNGSYQSAADTIFTIRVLRSHADNEKDPARQKSLRAQADTLEAAFTGGNPLRRKLFADMFDGLKADEILPAFQTPDMIHEVLHVWFFNKGFKLKKSLKNFPDSPALAGELAAYAGQVVSAPRPYWELAKLTFYLRGENNDLSSYLSTDQIFRQLVQRLGPKVSRAVRDKFKDAFVLPEKVTISEAQALSLLEAFKFANVSDKVVQKALHDFYEESFGPYPKSFGTFNPPQARFLPAAAHPTGTAELDKAA